MTSGGEPTLAVLRIKNAFSPSGNVTLLERPFRRITLQSVIHVALRARRKQHEVRNLLREQRTATELRDEFISVAGHELRTPLTSLKLQTQLHQRLIAQGDVAVYKPERMRRLVDLTARQVERLTRLVDDMLDISRINTGRLTLQCETFDLRQLVEETAERMRPQLESVGCNLTVHLCESIVGVWDRDRLEQVLSNLLTNVLRHCPGKPAHVTVSRSASRATLIVRDEGNGIAPENHERIFTRFERAITSTGASGLGLGLYICRQIVEAHRGTIHVESALGGGSSFIVALPVMDTVSLPGNAETDALRTATHQ
jgi:signal transduction histidine kinase